jgi:hypothetical protein
MQVQVGERLRLHSVAQGRIVLSNFGQLNLSQERIRISLRGLDVKLSLESGSNRVLFRILKKELQVRDLSAIDKQIVVTFTVHAIPVDQIAGSLNLRISNPVLYTDRIRFNLISQDGMEQAYASFSNGHLKLTRRTKLLFDRDFDAMVIRRVGNQFELPFSQFNLQELASKNHQVELSLGIKGLYNREELVNPELLDQLAMRPVLGSFSGFPVAVQP